MNSVSALRLTLAFLPFVRERMSSACSTQGAARTNRGRGRAVILALCLTAFAGIGQQAKADDAPGAACTGVVGAEGPLSATGNNLVCVSSLWQYPAYQFGASGATCNAGNAGIVQWTGSVLQVCTGAGGWGTLSGAATGTGTTNYVARWTGTTALGTGTLYDSGTAIGVGTASPGEATLQYANVLGNKEVFWTNATGQDYGVGIASSTLTMFIPSNAHYALRRNLSSGAEVATTDYNGNGYYAGTLGLGTAATGELTTYDSAAKTAAYTSALIDAFDTSTTASVNKVGMDVESTGGWTGTSAINTGLVVNATGGTTNYAATFSGGNVGIGTTAPLAVLDVNGTIAVSNNTNLYFKNSSGALDAHIFEAAGGGLDIEQASGQWIGFLNNTGTPLMIIGPGGNVGIGTTSPLASLQVGSATSVTNNSSAFILGEPTLSATLDAMDYVGEFRSVSANQDRLLFAEHRTVAGSDWHTAAWRIQPAVDNSYTAVNGNVGYLELAYGTAGSYHGIGLSGQGATTPDFVVNSSGNVGIGTTAPTSLLQSNDTAAKTAAYTGVLHGVYDTSATASVNKVGMDVESTGAWTGTSATNTGLVVNATGGTTNYAATFSGGNVGIGTATPINALDILGTAANPATTGTTTNGILRLKASGLNRILDMGLNSTTTASWIQARDAGGYGSDYALLLNPNGGSIGIGTGAPNATALLDAYSTTQGILPPRMTTVQRNAITTPATGLMIYNTDVAEMETYDGATYGWEAVGADASVAAGTTGQVQFNTAGALNASSNLFWDNTNYRLGIGQSVPLAPLQIGNDLTFTNNWAQIGFNFSGNSNLYLTTNYVASIGMNYTAGGLQFRTGPSGTAGTSPTMKSPLFLGSTGIVGIGTTGGGSTAMLQSYDATTQTAAYTGILHNVLDTSATASVNKVGMDVESTGAWTGTSAINTGLVVNATGGTTNYAATFNGGNVGIGTTSAAQLLSLQATAPAISLFASGSSRTATIGLTDTFNLKIDPGAGYLLLNTVSGAGVGVGTASPNATALVDMYSITKGILPPRMTTAQRNAISSPATGLVIYNTDVSELESYDGATYGWEAVGADASVAAGTTGQVQFNTGGNLNASANLFWDNTNNRLGIGTAVPLAPLDLGGVATNLKLAVYDGGSSNLYGIGATNSNLTFGAGIATGGTPQMVLNANGNVGIGTTTPTAQLENYDSGVMTASYTSSLVDAVDTSTTASVNKIGMDVESTGAWTGTSAINTGLVVNATGGTTNYAATFSGGNVGIGTTSPNAALDFGNSTANRATIYLYDGGTSSTRYGFGNNASELQSFIPTSNHFSWNAGGDLQTSGTNELMRLTGGGNVGIGTTTPTSLLQTYDNAAKTAAYTGVLHGVYDTSATASVNKVGMDVESTGAWTGTSATNTGLVVNATGGTTNYAATFSGGNVGIGTTSPSYALDVYGDLHVRGPSTNGNIYLQNNAATQQWLLTTVSNNTFSIYDSTNAKTPFIISASAPNYTFYANSSGNVGLGTNSSGSTLQVNGNTAIGYATSTTAPTNGLVVSGNVGIGTPTPAVKMDIIGTTLASNLTGTEDEFHITRLVNSGVSWPQVAAFQLGSYNTGVGTAPDSRLDINLKTISSNTLTGDTNVMTLLGSGNVGIGSTAPTSLLHTYDSAAKSAAYTGVLHNVLDTSTTASVNKVGMDVESTGAWTGTSAINTGLVVNATGGTTNYAATFSGGNVGIGSTTPLQALDVNGLIAADGSSSITSAPPSVGSAVGWKIGLYGNSYALGIAGFTMTAKVGNWFSIFGGSTNPANTATGTVPDPNAAVSFGSNGNGLFTGSVGIGTNNPAYSLHINNTGNSTIEMQSGGTGYYANTKYLQGATGEWETGVDTAQGYYINPAVGSGSTGAAMYISHAGKVGIGSTAPAAPLDVNGGIKIANDSTTCSTTTNGMLKYVSGTSPPWNYCNGSAWVPFESSNTSGGFTPTYSIFTAASISSGGNGVLALKSNGTLYGWGYGGNYQLPIGNANSELVPTQATTNYAGPWSFVNAGVVSSCAIKSADSSLWCWGNNSTGQLGNNSTTAASTAPVQVSGSWIQASTGGRGASTFLTILYAASYYSCGVKSDNTGWCWGNNNNGQLGNGTTTQSLVPVQVTGSWLSIWTFLDGYSTCGIQTDHSLWCWGWNAYGQLGIGSTTDTSTPTQVAGSWSMIVGGDLHMCGVQTNNTLWCWGNNSVGQIGDGTVTQRTSPVQIAGSWTKVSVSSNTGSNMTFGIKTDGSAWSWGYGGQEGLLNNLGVGNQTSPKSIVGVTQTTGTGWLDIEAGSSSVCGIQSDNTVYCWGLSAQGRLGSPYFGDQVVPVSGT